MKSNEPIMISTPSGKSTFMEMFEHLRQFAKEQNVVIITPKAAKIKGNECDTIIWDDIGSDRTAGMSRSFECTYGLDQLAPLVTQEALFEWTFPNQAIIPPKNKPWYNKHRKSKW